MNLKKEDLKGFGKIEKLEQNEKTVEILITDGFSTKARATFNLMQKISKKLPDYPIVDKLTTRENYFHLKVKKNG